MSKRRIIVKTGAWPRISAPQLMNEGHQPMLSRFCRHIANTCYQLSARLEHGHRCGTWLLSPPQASEAKKSSNVPIPLAASPKGNSLTIGNQVMFHTFYKSQIPGKGENPNQISTQIAFGSTFSSEQP